MCTLVRMCTARIAEQTEIEKSVLSTFKESLKRNTQFVAKKKTIRNVHKNHVLTRRKKKQTHDEMGT